MPRFIDLGNLQSLNLDPFRENKFFSLCPTKKSHHLHLQDNVQEPNVHIRSSVICVHIWTVINESSGWNVVARLESVYRLNNSVYNSWSFPSTPPSQFTAWGLLAHGHSVCSVTCSDQGYGTNWSLQYNFKHHTAFSSSQNLPLGKNLWFTGATKGESKTQNCIFKSSELKNRPRCRFYFSLFCWLCSCLPSLPGPSPIHSYPSLFDSTP